MTEPTTTTMNTKSTNRLGARRSFCGGLGTGKILLAALLTGQHSIAAASFMEGLAQPQEGRSMRANSNARRRIASWWRGEDA
jgi:hypothetical protein